MKFSFNGLAVNTYGDKKNQSIIFVHGFPYDSSMWDFQIEALKDEYHCVTYDVRGLGQSEVGDGQYTLEFFVNDFFSVINELKLKNPVLCGLSMGGYIALRAIEKDMDKFTGLILCDTRSEGDDNAGKLKRSENINMINTDGLDKFIEMFVTNTFSEEAPVEKEKLFKATIEKSKKYNPHGVKGNIIAIGSRTDTTHVLSQITIPTLVLVGSFDKLTPTIVMRDMAEKIPESEFAIIPGAGHMAPLENPNAVNDLIKGFLKRRITS